MPRAPRSSRRRPGAGRASTRGRRRPLWVSSGCSPGAAACGALTAASGTGAQAALPTWRLTSGLPFSCALAAGRTSTLSARTLIESGVGCICWLSVMSSRLSSSGLSCASTCEWIWVTIWLRICAVSALSGDALPCSESVRSASTPSRIAFRTSLRLVNTWVFGFGWTGRVSTVIGFWPGMLKVNDASVSVAVPVGPPEPAVHRPSTTSRLATRPPSPNCCLAWSRALLMASLSAWPPPAIWFRAAPGAARGAGRSGCWTRTGSGSRGRSCRTSR